MGLVQAQAQRVLFFLHQNAPLGQRLGGTAQFHAANQAAPLGGEVFRLLLLLGLLDRRCCRGGGLPRRLGGSRCRLRRLRCGRPGRRRLGACRRRHRGARRIRRKGQHAQQGHFKNGLGVRTHPQVPIAHKPNLIVKLHRLGGHARTETIQGGTPFGFPQGLGDGDVMKRLQQVGQRGLKVRAALRQLRADIEHCLGAAAPQSLQHGG